MNVLIIKLGATGDVVRTTPLLRRLNGSVTWVTAFKNRPLLEGLTESAADLHLLAWEDRHSLEGKSFDLVINLEDDIETASLLSSVRAKRVFGAYANGAGMSY